MLDYLAIGHICADLQPDGSTRLGGTALFAALAAHRLGFRAAIVTACAADLDLRGLPPDLPVLRQPSPVTTMFENRYTGNHRQQFVHARAGTIMLQPEQLPLPWQSPAIVHFAPIIDEVPPAAHLFPAALVGATPQGWLRSIGADRQVRQEPSMLAHLPLHGMGAMILSEEDVSGDEKIVQAVSRRVPIVALTRAERGATIFVQGAPTDVPALPATPLDPTGAGDVFAAALLLALHESSEPFVAARWACAAAACAIEGVGTARLPTRAEVSARLKMRD